MSSTSGTSYLSGTGIDVTSTVDQLIYVARAPERAWQTQQSTINVQKKTLQSVQSQLVALQSAVNSLKDISGALSLKTVSSTNSGVSISATASAATGTHTVVVDHAATTSSVYSSLIAEGATFANGSFKFTVGGVERTVVIDGTSNKVSTLVDKINAGDYGVTATAIKDATGQHISLLSKTSGELGELEVTAAPSGVTFQTGVEARDASLSIDGVPITSASNTIADFIPGLTLNLDASASGPATVRVAADTSAVKQAVSSFVNAYNAVIDSINSQSKYTEGSAAPSLFGDAGLRTVQSVLGSMISTKVTTGSTTRTLRSVGINMADDGKLSIVDATLETAMSDATSLKAFFQDPTNGFATKFTSTMMNLASTTDGALSVEITGLQNSYDALQDQIDDFDVRLESKRTSLLEEYSRIDTMLRQLPTLIQQITSQTSSLINSNK